MKTFITMTVIIMAIAFLDGCSGPPDQQSQKETTRHPVKTAKQYDPWPKHEKSTVKPLTFDDLNKSPEELRKQAEKARADNQKRMKQFSGKTNE